MMTKGIYHAEQLCG